jgi:hypothetical protein
MTKNIKVTVDGEGDVGVQPKIARTPSEQMVADAAKEISFVGPSGKTYKLAKPDLLSEIRLTALVGGDRAMNPAYMMMLAPIMYITEVDGDVLSFPMTFSEVEARIKRIEHDYIALSKKILKVFSEAADAEAAKTTIKK